MGRKTTRNYGAAVRDPVAAVPNEVAPVSDAVAPVSVAVAPVPDVVGPASDVSGLVQDMLTSVAGAVVPLTQLPSDLYSFLLGIAGVQPVVGGVAGIHGPGLSAAAGASVASRLPLGLPRCGYLGPATRRCLGPAGERRGNRGCNARCDCARSSVSGVRDGTGSARCRVSDRCRVDFPACFQRTPATRFTVGAGRWRFARRRRAWFHYPGRGARGIPSGQSRCRITHNGHRALHPSGAARYRPPDGIARRPPEGIARRPSRGVKRRTSSR